MGEFATREQDATEAKVVRDAIFQHRRDDEYINGDDPIPTATPTGPDAQNLLAALGHWADWDYGVQQNTSGEERITREQQGQPQDATDARLASNEIHNHYMVQRPEDLAKLRDQMLPNDKQLDLSIVTLINRAGTMVIPFLSLYLTKEKHYSLSDVGWIMSFFGLGSVTGSWLGGKLTDRIGFYKVMTGSLIVSSALFISLQFLNSFAALCCGIYFLMCAADAFRPAMFVALNAYSKPENKTRSVTLVRLAINLGFAAGPALGGFIILAAGYAGLFWVDGLTSLLAGLVLLKLLHPRTARTIDDHVSDKSVSAYSDYNYWIFILVTILFGIVFMQYFSTVPVYYRDVHALNEKQIGLLMGLNGLLIFFFEMPLVHALEKRKFKHLTLIFVGLFLLGFSFFLLNMSTRDGILIIALVFMSFGEMLVFPFSNSFAMEYSKRGKRGEYMALYSIAFSISHVFSHNAGMQSIHVYGFVITWYSLAVISVIGMLLLIRLNFVLKKGTEITHE